MNEASLDDGMLDDRHMHEYSKARCTVHGIICDLNNAHPPPPTPYVQGAVHKPVQNLECTKIAHRLSNHFKIVNLSVAPRV